MAGAVQRMMMTATATESLVMTTVLASLLDDPTTPTFSGPGTASPGTITDDGNRLTIPFTAPATLSDGYLDGDGWGVQDAYKPDDSVLVWITPVSIDIDSSNDAYPGYSRVGLGESTTNAASTGSSYPQAIPTAAYNGGDNEVAAGWATTNIDVNNSASVPTAPVLTVASRWKTGAGFASCVLTAATDDGAHVVGGTAFEQRGDGDRDMLLVLNRKTVAHVGEASTIKPAIKVTSPAGATRLGIPWDPRTAAWTAWTASDLSSAEAPTSGVTAEVNPPADGTSGISFDLTSTGQGRGLENMVRYELAWPSSWNTDYHEIWPARIRLPDSISNLEDWYVVIAVTLEGVEGNTTGHQSGFWISSAGNGCYPGSISNSGTLDLATAARMLYADIEASITLFQLSGPGHPIEGVTGVLSTEASSYGGNFGTVHQHGNQNSTPGVHYPVPMDPKIWIGIGHRDGTAVMQGEIIVEYADPIKVWPRSTRAGHVVNGGNVTSGPWTSARSVAGVVPCDAVTLASGVKSVACWVYSDGANSTILGGGVDAADPNSFEVKFSATQQISVKFRDGAGNRTQAFSDVAVVSVDAWHHLMVCLVGTDSSDILVYLDGVSVAMDKPAFAESDATSIPPIALVAGALDRDGTTANTGYVCEVAGWESDESANAAAHYAGGRVDRMTSGATVPDVYVAVRSTDNPDKYTGWFYDAVRDTTVTPSTTTITASLAIFAPPEPS